MQAARYGTVKTAKRGAASIRGGARMRHSPIWGRDRALPQCVRADRPALSEGAGTESTGSDGERASVSGRAVMRDGDFYRAYDCRRQEVSPRADANSLIEVSGSPYNSRHGKITI